jgi:CheY-like chemotaxis protein
MTEDVTTAKTPIVMVVDDEALNLKLITAMLKPQG